jgi:uncharacterized protein YciI
MHIADPRQVPSGVFLYTLHPARLEMLTDGPTAEEQALAARHWVYSQELLARGVVVFAGRTLTRDASSFAAVAIRVPSPEAAREIVDADPAVAGGMFTAQLFPFQPMLMGAWPPEAATVPPAA